MCSLKTAIFLVVFICLITLTNVYGLSVNTLDNERADIAWLESEESESDTQNPLFEVAGLTGGVIRDVWVQDQYAYCGSASGLLILDISDANRPKRVSSIIMKAWDIAVSGNYAYVSYQSWPIKVVDITEPNAPKLLGSCRSGGYVYDIFASDSFVYLATETGLHIIDVSDPNEPQLVGSCLMNERPLSVYVSDGYGYLTGDSGMHIVDVSEPDLPEEAGFYSTPDQAWDVHVSGGYAYVAANTGANSFDAFLHVVDISIPELPVRVGMFETEGFIADVHIYGNYAYLLSRGVRIVDISDSTSPVEIGVYETSDVPGIHWAVCVSGANLYLAGSSGLYIADVSNAPFIHETAEYDLNSTVEDDWFSAYDIQVSNDYAYIVSKRGLYDYGLTVIDVSDPFTPAYAGFCPADLDYNSKVQVFDSNAYVNTRDNLLVIDVSNPHLPVIRGFLGTPIDDYIIDFTVSEKYAYVLSQTYLRDYSLHTIDVSSPLAPVEVAVHALPYGVGKISVIGSYAYLITGYGLYIWDISWPTGPREVGSYETSQYVLDYYVRNTRVYLVDNSNSIQIIDVSDRTAPVLTGNYEVFERTENIFVSDSYTYLDTGSGLHVLDVSVSGIPEEVGSYALSYTGTCLDVSNGYAYNVRRNNILHVLDVSNPISVSSSGNYASADSVRDVYVCGPYAYLAADGLRIFDVTDPASPTEVGFYDGSAVRLCVSGNFAYTVEPLGRLDIFDVSNPAAPEKVGYYLASQSLFIDPLNPYIRDICVSGSYAYLATASDLRIIDVSNPGSVQQVGSYAIQGGTRGFVLTDSYAYVIDSDRGMHIIDISNPAAPQESGLFLSPDTISDIFLVGTRIYLATATGFRILSIFEPTEPQEIGFWKNPSGYDSTNGAIYVSGSYAYFLHDFLYLVDISEPSMPEKAGAFVLPSSVSKPVIFGADPYIYFACGDCGLFILKAAADSD